MKALGGVLILIVAIALLANGGIHGNKGSGSGSGGSAVQSTSAAYVNGRVGTSCSPTILNVGDKVEIDAKIRNLSNVDWPNTYLFIGGADHLVRQIVADDTGGIAGAPNGDGDFALRGIRPHEAMKAYAIFVAKDAGNYTLELDAWGGGNVDQGIPAKPLTGGCDVTVNP